jgi:hypothetical protein
LPAGRHAVAGLLGANPTQQLDGNLLLRMKRLLEIGRPPTTPPGQLSVQTPDR